MLRQAGNAMCVSRVGFCMITMLMCAGRSEDAANMKTVGVACAKLFDTQNTPRGETRTLAAPALQFPALKTHKTREIEDKHLDKDQSAIADQGPL